MLSAGIRGSIMAKWFEASIRWAVANPLKSVAISLILPVLGFVSFPTLTAQFFPGVDRDQFYLEVELAAGTSINEKLRAVDGIDAELRGAQGIKTVYWSIGKSGPAFYSNIVSGRSQEPGFAQALITSESPADSGRLVLELQEQLDKYFPSARVLVRGLVHGPPVAAPVELRFVGQDIAVLRDLGDQARAITANLDIITMARATVNGGAPKARLILTKQKPACSACRSPALPANWRLA